MASLLKGLMSFSRASPQPELSIVKRAGEIPQGYRLATPEEVVTKLFSDGKSWELLRQGPIETAQIGETRSGPHRIARGAFAKNKILWPQNIVWICPGSNRVVISPSISYSFDGGVRAAVTVSADGRQAALMALARK